MKRLRVPIRNFLPWLHFSSFSAVYGLNVHYIIYSDFMNVYLNFSLSIFLQQTRVYSLEEGSEDCFHLMDNIKEIVTEMFISIHSSSM